MKVGKKARHGRHKRSPQPHNNNKRNYRPSPGAKQKRVRRRRLKAEWNEEEAE